MWAKKVGGNTIDRGTSVSIDSTGHILLGGSFMGVADFDPSAGVSNMTSIGVQDGFIAKYDAVGNLVWARQLGAASSSTQNIMSTIDSSDNVVSVGSFQNTVDFDPGAGTTTVTSAGGFDAYIWKLDSSGALLWGRSLGGSSSDVANAVAVDASGNAYVGGGFQGTIDFDPGVGVVSATTAGSTDAFAWKLDVSGVLVWGRQLGGLGSDSVSTVGVDSSTNSIFGGNFVDTADFDPSNSAVNLTSLGASDAFVWKLDTAGFPTAPSSSTSSSSSTSTVAPSTSVASVVTSTTTLANTTTTTVNNAVSAAGSSTTVVASRVNQSANLPTTGSSQLSLILWASLIVLMGIGLQLRVNYVVRNSELHQ